MKPGWQEYLRLWCWLWKIIQITLLCQTAENWLCQARNSKKPTTYEGGDVSGMAAGSAPTHLVHWLWTELKGELF